MWSKMIQNCVKKIITKISKSFHFFSQKSKEKFSSFSWCFHMESPQCQRELNTIATLDIDYA